MYRHISQYSKQQIEQLDITEVFVRTIEKMAEKVGQATVLLQKKEYEKVREIMLVAHDLMEGIQNSIDEPAENKNPLFMALRSYFRSIHKEMVVFEMRDRAELGMPLQNSLLAVAKSFRDAIKAEKEKKSQHQNLSSQIQAPEKEQGSINQANAMDDLIQNVKQESFSISA